MDIIRIDSTTAEKLAPLVAGFRVTLDSYRGVASQPDQEAAKEEILELFSQGYPIFAAADGEEFVGYIVCRIEEPCLWVEHFYVLPGYRRRGIATGLFCKAEDLARQMGEDTVFNFVHPNNDGMIAFLRSRGYTVLNMIEIRKPYRNEELHTKINVADNVFDY